MRCSRGNRPEHGVPTEEGQENCPACMVPGSVCARVGARRFTWARRHVRVHYWHACASVYLCVCVHGAGGHPQGWPCSELLWFEDPSFHLWGKRTSAALRQPEILGLVEPAAVWSGKFTTVSELTRPSLCAPVASPALTLNPSRSPHFTACSSPGINSSRELSTSYSLMQMAGGLPPRPRSFHALPGHTCPGGHRGPLWLRPRCPDGHPAMPVFGLEDPCQPALVASAARLLPYSLTESSGVLPRPFPRGPVETLTLAPIFLMLPVPDGTLRIRDAQYWAPRLDARWPGQSTPTSTQGRQARPPLASQLVVGAVREGWGAQVPGSPGSS